jgi:hypothetical protein
MIRQSILDILKEQSSKVTEVESSMETPIKVQSEVPDNGDGFSGDRVVVENDAGSFLYIKVADRWMKTDLEEV